MPKFIFVTGGVVSSVGKGITTASLGRILKSRGISVTIQKLDPYLNVDPGTMSPYQHGEVFVTSDGAETDLDLGHYERFIDQDLSQASSVTSGQVYLSVLERERRGDYLGGTIQAVPHLTNEIKARIRAAVEASKADVIICEVGGTVGDIEGQTFIEAIRQMRHEEPRENHLSVHVTFLPWVGATGELKTKPTQHSVRELRSMGIQPDVIITRSDHPVAREICDKIALFCDVDPAAVIPLETVSSIYEVPLILEERGLGGYVIDRLGLSGGRDLAEWREMVDRLKHPAGSIEVAVVGKYVELHDAYMSVKESLAHAGISSGVEVDIRWVPAEDLETREAAAVLEGVDGIIVPGGFGERGWEGKVRAATYARTRGVPYFGLCLGMQVLVTEFARNVCGMAGANSTEFDPETPFPVISLLEEQLGVTNKGGTMRLGAYPCRLTPGSSAAAAYGTDMVSERHRHRWEFNNRYRAELEAAGLVVSGLSPDGTLVEIAEIGGHPFMLGTQFHPELQSRPNRPHPLFREFVAAAVAHRRTALTFPDGAAVAATS
ncbi:MAG: CTP synthase [Dehalococcoidia bacterium]|nr:MAG: CTP synthase [bacterium]MCE7929067.1 CTP synthase [Chloroflexi bacterium CFX7]MCK6564255.1 CTP synthase [Dehalococcoidia bacterium]MCL4232631.1 CTP synthase [Dehalococcoidia bacterium]NUQ55491.1 CTP synthase [Dehalococcoidia bacterium]